MLSTSSFDKDAIFAGSEELKNNISIKNCLKRECDEPSDDIVNFIPYETYSAGR